MLRLVSVLRLAPEMILTGLFLTETDPWFAPRAVTSPVKARSGATRARDAFEVGDVRSPRGHLRRSRAPLEDPADVAGPGRKHGWLRDVASVETEPRHGSELPDHGRVGK